MSSQDSKGAPPPTEPPPPYSPSANSGPSSSSSLFAPPPGPPPGHPSTIAGPSRQTATPLQDTTPTPTPTPGRPLLNQGQVLIYKPGFHCEKCRNTGYKHDDPSHPCRTCWKKYGRPYTGAVASSWPRQGAAGPLGTTLDEASNFQRPLRMFSGPADAATGPPVLNTSWTQPGLIRHGGQANHQHHWPQAQAYPTQLPPPPAQGDFKASASSPPPIPPPHQPYVQPHTFWQPTGPGPIIPVSPYDRPPPGAHVVHAGDPRLGGLPCPECYGYGYVESFWGFDTKNCWRCQGIGRIF